ncbi:MAG: hypothetical protein M1823_001995 [Watsoniomyces obsoletus]|nr:MAG: hypothetical protein M1823_001995 [Watsoniomyces obsoletus]
MANDPGVGRSPPQGMPPQTYMFVPPTVGSRENQKNYVFVDEHNRHKRLKVMRACEGCRRRKIKCDAATTNSWPCSACVRLKLQCIPPSLNQEFETGDGSGSYDYGKMEDSMNEEIPAQRAGHRPLQPHPTLSGGVPLQSLPQRVSFGNGGANYGAAAAPLYGVDQTQDGPFTLSFAGLQDSTGDLSELQYQPTVSFATPSSQTAATIATPESWQSDPYSPEHLSDALGELRVDESGVAPYISQQKKSLAEAPAMEEFDEYVRNLPQPSGPDLTVRIPPEFMPSEQKARHYFDIFFEHIHPYVPVINKRYFYQQWHTNRESISPLILEAIFACAAGLSEDSTQGYRWLALAGKHADSFMDVPRLSTLQALLLILKAREASPKRGYYFRSWLTVVTLIDMAKELGLDEHHGLHQEGIPCGSTYNDCVTKTRVWQTLFICELMIGAPQGRSDMSVDPDTVDLAIPSPSPGLDEFDLRISRDWVFFSRMIRTVRRMNDTVAKVKKKKDWGSDPRWVQIKPDFQMWLDDLPPDLRVTYPADGSPPWLPSHFVGNLHSYRELSVIMLHRPLLAASDSFALDGDWKHHMLQCYAAAKNLCRLQEAVLRGFGLSGLRCMQRGLGFTIYAVLTCTVLHLVAITSPDAELSMDAPDYFSRHMRILEQCISSWPMPHVKAQIDALREAFSADTGKPFVLKRSFPYNSPTMTQYQQMATSSGSSVHLPTSPPDPMSGSSQQLEYPGHSLSPPLSSSSAGGGGGGGGIRSRTESPAALSVGSMSSTATATQAQHQQMTTSAAVPMLDPMTWNPSKIFE